MTTKDRLEELVKELEESDDPDDWHMASFICAGLAAYCLGKSRPVLIELQAILNRELKLAKQKRDN